jgi:hypothetical protein
MMNKIHYLLMFLSFPLLARASEDSKGTVIMISSVAGWLLLTSALVLWRYKQQSKGTKPRE